MRAEVCELTKADADGGVNLHVQLIDEAGRVEAIVMRLAPNPGRFGTKTDRYICSCWKADGMTVHSFECQHIQYVQHMAAQAEPRSGMGRSIPSDATMRSAP